MRERFPNPTDEEIPYNDESLFDKEKSTSQPRRWMNRIISKWKTSEAYWTAEVGPSNSRKSRIRTWGEDVFHKYKYRACGTLAAAAFIYFLYSTTMAYFYKRPVYKGIVDPMFNPPAGGLRLYDLDEVDAVMAWARAARADSLLVDGEIEAGYFSTPIYGAPDPRNVSLELLRTAMLLNCVDRCACISALQLGIPRDIILMTDPDNSPLFMVNPTIPYHSTDGAVVEFSKSAGSSAPPRKKWAPRVAVFDYQLFPVPASGARRSSRSFNAGKGSCGYYYLSLATDDIKH